MSDSPRESRSKHRSRDPADERPAGGLGAVMSTVSHARTRMGVRRAVQTLARVNQTEGFDCPGCAWPDPRDRARIEFCENGAKAVAHEATRSRVPASLFGDSSIQALLERSDHWLEQQGRLTQPLFKPADRNHYEVIDWEQAFERVGTQLAALASPDQAAFYTSGRTSNEAAFLYQLFARQFGTNNLPDCSNMCHESSGTGLREVIGVGKGTVGLEDFELADAIFVIGQNPGTNHPRMLTALQAAKRRGCRIVSINPLRERGLVAFAHPQEPLGLLGHGTTISDLYLQVRVGGDIALLKGVMKEVLAAEDSRPGEVLDAEFIRDHCAGFEALEHSIRGHSWQELERDSGVERAQMRQAAEIFCGAERVIACWAMGITQHVHGVANVQEIVNLLLLRGNLGVPGAGVCPVRGHSNVQGDRTVGITEQPNEDFLTRLGQTFDFEPPREHGLDTVGTIRAMSEGRVRVFVGMGGNFAVAAPDSEFTAAALRRCDLTVHIATTLNRSHLITGREALVLPCLGRTERDDQRSGPQFVSVENSMSVVHRSAGRLEPASEHLRSEPSIVAGIARATLGASNPVPWEELVEDYDRIRARIESVIPGFENYNTRVRSKTGFVLPSEARERRFDTRSGLAEFTVHALPASALAPGQLRLTTIRSHDQFNTTVYGLDDRYRGVRGDRRVVFVNPSDLRARDLNEGERVDVTSHLAGRERCVRGFRIIPYDLPKGCAAAYFPEANPLVPLEAIAEGSRTPAYKSIVVTLMPSAARG